MSSCHNQGAARQEALIRHFLQTYKFGQLRRIDVSSSSARGASDRLSCIGLQDYVVAEFAGIAIQTSGAGERLKPRADSPLLCSYSGKVTCNQNNQRQQHSRTVNHLPMPMQMLRLRDSGRQFPKILCA